MFKRIWKARSGYLFILPKFILFTVFVLVPIVWSLFVSFQEYRIFGTEWVGLRNFIDAFQDDLFWQAVSNTLRYAVVVTPASVIIALVLASLIHPLRAGAQTFFRASFYLPTVASSVVIAMVWRWIFQTRFGLANYFLGLLGVEPINWLHSSAWALKSVILMAVLTPPGTGIILYLAAMGSIPDSLYEAARIDGAIAYAVGRYLPWKPTTLYCFIVFTRFFPGILRGDDDDTGGPASHDHHRAPIYNVAFRDFQFGYAGAMSMLLFAAVIILALIQSKLVSSDVEYKG